MQSLTTRHQIFIALVLAALMIITRGQHFASLHTLPGASWAVFFLAGVYLRSAWPLFGFIALSWLLDFAGYVWGGTSGFCLTPAYVFLLPAYSSLWLAGRWYATRHSGNWRTLLPLSGSMLSGLMLCQLFSSGGFYFFSGRFTDTNFLEFYERLLLYSPMYIESFLFYVGFAAAIHVAIAAMMQSSRLRNTVSH